MGGTTFDVSLIVGSTPIRKSLGVVNQYEYSVPTIDVQSIGSGGGSIVWIDERSRSLRVGPRSAGSTPGPACYGRGGREPTITDCDLLLGYLSPDAVLGGAITLDIDLSLEAIRTRISEPLGMSVEEAALGALTIVDFQMAELMRQVTVGNGHDPRDFVVFAYGGAGPMHAPVFARELGAKGVVVPGGALASVWSAYGAVSSDAVVVLERSHVRHEPFDANELEVALAGLELEACEKLHEFGVGDDGIVLRRYADLKYGMQAHVVDIELPLVIDDVVAKHIPELLDTRYESIFGSGTAYREAGIVMSRIRVEAIVPDPTEGSSLPPTEGVDASTAQIGTRPVWWPAYEAAVESPVFDGAALGSEDVVEGTAIIELAVTTIPVHPGQVVKTDNAGNFLIELEKAPSLQPLSKVSTR
jgi:N-methylhydantoinase A